MNSLMPGVLAIACLWAHACAQPVPDVDLGRRDRAETIEIPVRLEEARGVFWCRVSLPEVTVERGFVDIWTRFLDRSSTDMRSPHGFLFSNDGRFVSSVAGVGSYLMMYASFGLTEPVRPPNVILDDWEFLWPFDGAWGPLADGEYWLAIANGPAGAYDGWDVRSAQPVQSPERNIMLYIRVHPPELPFCDPDLDWSGVADQDDVAYLVNIMSGGYNDTNRSPDYNQDGLADQDDVLALINVIAGGECP